MARGRKSGRWVQQHVNDFHVKLAIKEGYRSRAAFKLLEIQKKDKLVSSGMLVADLGAAPGGWSQIIADLVAPEGKVFSVDLTPISPIAGVTFLEGDIRDGSLCGKFDNFLKDAKLDVVVSDLSPDLTGIHQADQAKMQDLFQVAIDFIRFRLKPGGSFLVKVFQGVNIRQVRGTMETSFKKLVTRKPRASRSKSTEFYLLGKGFKGEASKT